MLNVLVLYQCHFRTCCYNVPLTSYQWLYQHWTLNILLRCCKSTHTKRGQVCDVALLRWVFIVIKPPPACDLMSVMPGPGVSYVALLFLQGPDMILASLWIVLSRLYPALIYIREPQPLATAARSGANAVDYHWAHWACGAGFGRHGTIDDPVWTLVVYQNTWQFVATRNTPMDTFQTPPTQQKCLLFYWPLIFLLGTFCVLVLLVGTLSPMYDLSTPRMHSSVLGVLVSQTTGTLLPDLFTI